MSGKKLVATRELPREPNKQPSLASFGQCVSVRACVCKYAVRTLALSSLPDTESGFLSYERPPQNESEEEINRTGSFLALAPHFATTTIKQEERKEKDNPQKTSGRAKGIRVFLQSSLFLVASGLKPRCLRVRFWGAAAAAAACVGSGVLSRSPPPTAQESYLLKKKRTEAISLGPSKNPTDKRDTRNTRN